MGVFFARGSRTHGSRVVVTLAIDDNDGDEVSLMPCSKFRGFCLGQLNQQMKLVKRLSFRKQGFSFFPSLWFYEVEENWNKQAKV